MSFPLSQPPRAPSAKRHPSTDLAEVDPQWAWEMLTDAGEPAWDAQQARHLLSRAGFGATPEEVRQAVTAGREATLETVLNGRADELFEETTRTLEQAILPRREIEGFVALWLHRMRHSPFPLLEKMTLFWHGHFATSAAKVTQAKLMFDQHRLLREHALGNFEPLVLGISRDPAMLIYLDSTENRKTHPNENYARELMELFCLGLGNYTERDIQEVARCFTGWEVRREKFRFNRYQHDRGTKQFLEQTGEFGGEEAVQVILEQPAAARFLARKLIRFFMFDAPDIPDRLVEPLAETLRRHDFEMQPALRQVFGCRLFQSTHCYGQKIRSPIELTVGVLRTLDATTDWYRLGEKLGRLGQKPYFPPNVKGWDGGRDWINSATMLERQNFIFEVAKGRDINFADEDLLGWMRRHDVESPSSWLAFLLDQLLMVPVSEETRQSLAAIVAEGSGTGADQLSRCIAAIGSLPEFQLT